MKLFGTFLGLSAAIPSVIWHGMGDKGNSGGMTRIANMIRDGTGNYVHSLMIGETGADKGFNHCDIAYSK